MSYDKKGALGDLMEAIDVALPPDQKVAWWNYAREDKNAVQRPDQNVPDSPAVYSRRTG